MKWPGCGVQFPKIDSMVVMIGRTGSEMACTVAVVAFLAADGASGWMVEGSVTYGCHERMTMEALGVVGYVAPPPDLTRDDRLLFESVGFDASYLDRNRWALDMALGVRHFDVDRYSAVDLGMLTALHNQPDTQANHCLRASWEDGEEGDAQAVSSCRGVIREEMALAWDSGDVDGRPDPWVTEDVEVYLLYQGARVLPVSRFYFHLGRALHVVQDSFTHCYRTRDARSIAEVTNWVEDVTGERKLDRDGPPHQDSADDCQCGRQWVADLRASSLLASVDLITLASMEGTRPEREEALESFLRDWVSHVPDCTADNGWCASPLPVGVRESPCGGCSVSGVDSHGPGAALVACTVLVAALLARMRR